MKINDDHMYHGSALTQIAEHPQFTAINAFKTEEGISRSAFKINDDIGVYLKYSSAPKPPYNEYVFTFNREHLSELLLLSKKVSKVFIAFVCVKARQICCLSYPQLLRLIQARANAKGSSETQYSVLITAPQGKSFRVYVNAPGKRNTKLGEIIISRNDFPDVLFSEASVAEPRVM